MSFPLSLAAFRGVYPEFVDAPDALVQGKLTMAERRIDSTVWGDKAEDGHGLLAAHLITMSPYGRDARIVVDGATTTTYGVEYSTQAELVGGAYRMILDEPETLET